MLDTENHRALVFKEKVSLFKNVQQNLPRFVENYSWQSKKKKKSLLLDSEGLDSLAWDWRAAEMQQKETEKEETYKQMFLWRLGYAFIVSVRGCDFII